MEQDNFETTSSEVESAPEVLVKPVKVLFKSMRVSDKCQVLNVRKSPSIESDVLRLLMSGAIVNVNVEKSTEDFYYVASEIIDSEHKIPIHGFCKKEFIVD